MLRESRKMAMFGRVRKWRENGGNTYKTNKKEGESIPM